MRCDATPVQRRGLAETALEQFAERRVVHEPEPQHAVLQVADRHAPARHAAYERLGAVDRIDDPHPVRVGQPAGAGLLAEERVAGKLFRDASREQQLDLHVGLGDHVLRAFGSDSQLIEPGEVGRGQITGRLHQRTTGVVPRLDLGRRHHRHSQAAPRTPLESPCVARTTGV